MGGGEPLPRQEVSVPEVPPIIELLPTTPPVSNVYSEPASRVRVLYGWLAELGMATALSASRTLLERADQLEAEARAGVTASQARYDAAYKGVVAGTVTPAELARTLAAEAPWLDADVAGGRAAVAMVALQQAGQDMRAQAAALLEGEGSGLYGRLQAIARDVVREVAALPPLAPAVWSAATDPGTAAVRAGQGETWADLLRAADKFSKVHQAGALLRRFGGLGAQAMPPGAAPDLAFLYRAWWVALERLDEVRRLKPPLRLPFGVREGLQPGLWLASELQGDVPDEPEPGRGLLDRLRGR
jgi:hypothetical protein